MFLEVMSIIESPEGTLQQTSLLSKFNLSSHLFFQRRREETVCRTDLSSYLTGAVLIQIIVDGHITRVGRKTLQEAQVTFISPEVKVMITLAGRG